MIFDSGLLFLGHPVL